MKNRDWLLKQDNCDFLKRVNKSIKANSNDDQCIMDAIMNKKSAVDRCNKYLDDCTKCIEAWMNESHD